MQRFSVQDRILVHLLDYFRAQEAFVAPPEVTQHGIARALGIERSNVPYAVKRLTERELVEERVSHVEGEKRRRKVYFLTPLGFREANGVREMMEAAEVLLRDGVSTAEVTLGELAGNLGMSVLDLTTIAAKKGPISAKELKRLSAPQDGKVRMMPPLPPLRWYYGRDQVENRILSALSDPKVSAAVVYGIAGVGKSTMARHLADGPLSQKNLWWWKVHEWDTPRSLLTSLSEFLASAGKGRFKDYVDSRKTIDVGDAARMFYEEARALDPVLVLDDYHSASAEVVGFLRALFDASHARVRLLLFGRERKPFYDRRDVAITNRVVEIEVKGLDRDSSLDFLTALEVPRDKQERVYEATGGHPLAIELLHLADPESLTKSVDLSRFFYEEIFSALSQGEMDSLKRLSVFRDPVPWDAIEGADERLFLDLERMAIVTATETGLYSIHESLSGVIYAALERNEREGHHRAAAGYYAADYPDAKAPLDLLPEEEADLVEWLYHLVRGGDYERAIQLIQRHGEEMLDRGYLQDFMVLINEFDKERLDGSGEATIQKLKADILTVWGEWDEASKVYEAALAKAGDDLMLGAVRNKLGVVMEHMGKWDRALEEYGQAIEIFQRTGNRRGIAEAQRSMGIVHRKRGRYDKALNSYESSLDIFEELGDKKGLARVLNSIGVLHDVSGRPAKARKFFLRSLEYAREAGEKRMIGAAYNNMGEALKMEARYADALEYYLLALQVQEELGERQGVAVSLNNVGDIYITLGEPEEGLAYLERSMEVARDLSDRYLQGSILRNMGKVYQDSDPAKTEDLLDQALETYKALGALEKIRLIENDLKALREKKG